MLVGDLSTMSLADLLQWIDATATAGLLTIRQDDVDTVLALADRSVVEISSPPPAASSVRDLAPGGGAWPIPPEVEASERLLDLFLENDGSFELLPGGRLESGTLGVPTQLPIRWVVLEGMRARDEWPHIAKAYPNHGARLSRAEADAPEDLSDAADVLLTCAEDGRTIAESRLALGFSSPALLRHLHLLRSLDLIEVEGVKAGADPMARLLRQVLTLVEEKQYAEASHVVESMLASDPGDQALRDLLERIHTEQISTLYDELQRTRMLHPVGEPSGRMAETDRHVLGLVDGRRTTQQIVRASALREVETLKSLARLEGRGLLA
jgi:hypothetical protein